MVPVEDDGGVATIVYMCSIVRKDSARGTFNSQVRVYATMILSTKAVEFSRTQYGQGKDRLTIARRARRTGRWC